MRAWVLGAAAAVGLAGGAEAATISPGFAGPGYIYQTDPGQTLPVEFAVELTDPSSGFSDLFSDPALVAALISVPTLDFGSGVSQVVASATSLTLGGGIIDTFGNYVPTASGELCAYEGETTTFVTIDAAGLITFTAFNTDALVSGPAECDPTTYLGVAVYRELTATGSWTPVNGAPAIPVPATAPLLGLALAGMMLVRRR